MDQIDKQPQELDRWENEGGALSAEKASDSVPVGFPEKTLLPLAGRKAVPANVGPTRRAAHDRFFAKLTEETANALKTLKAPGGYGEARTEVQREAMTVPMRPHFPIARHTRPVLITYEITNAGRQYKHGLSS